jgi:hypothetical protein
MGDLHEPYGYGAVKGFSLPAAAGDAGVAAAEEDMRGGESRAPRRRMRGRARWRMWAGVAAGERTGEKMEARRVAICRVRALFL